MNFTVPCDVCGEPATSLARDVFRREELGQSFATFTTSPKLKAGCDAHPVESIEHTTQLLAPKEAS